MGSHKLGEFDVEARHQPWAVMQKNAPGPRHLHATLFTTNERTYYLVRETWGSPCAKLLLMS